MRKAFTILLSMMLGMSVMAQQKIQLRSVDKAECVKSDMTSLKATFSFSGLRRVNFKAIEVSSQRSACLTLSSAAMWVILRSLS